MKLTKRGKRVRAVAILLSIALVWWVSGHLWYVDGWCLGTIDECVKGGL